MATVIDKSSGEAVEYPLYSVEESTNSVIKLDIGPEEVAGFERQGNDLVIMLQSGQQVTIPGFFVSSGAGRNELVLQDSNGVLWLGQYDQPWSDFSFAEIGSIDALLAGGEEAAAGGGFGTLGMVAAGLGAAGLVAAAAGSGGSDGGDSAGDGGGGDGGDPPPTDGVQPPTVETENGEGITGSSRTDTTVILYDEQGNEVARSEVDSNGDWAVPADEFPGGNPDGFEGEVVAEDEDGNQSEPVGVGPIDGEAPDNPNVESANGDGLSGSAEPGARVVVRDSEGNKIAETTADGDGDWSVPAGAFPGDDPDGFEGEVVAIDDAGNESGPTDVGPIDGRAPEKPVVETANGEGVSGTAEAGSTVIIRGRNGEEVSETTVDGDGNWSVPAGDFPGGDTDGFQGEAVAVDDAGNESGPTDVGPIDGQAPEAPVVESANGEGLSGTAEAGSTVIVRDNDSNQVAETSADGDGNWSVPASGFPGGDPDGFEGDVVAVDDAGNESPATDVGPIDAEPPDAPVILELTADGLVGTAEANSTVTVRNAAGEIVASAEADALGNWDVGSGQFDESDLAGYQGSVTATDDAGNESGTTDFTFPDSPNDPVVEQQDDAAIAGSVDVAGTDGEVTVILTNEAGDEVAQTVADANGNWAFTADELDAAGEDIVGFDGEVVARNEAGFASQPAAVSVASVFAQDDAITADILIDTSAGTSEPQQLDDMVLDGGLLGIGAESSTSQQFTVEEGSVGALDFTASSGSVLELLSSGASIELQRKNEDTGEFETVGTLEEDSGLLGADLLGLTGTDQDVSQAGIPPGEYNLVLSRQGGVEVLSGDVSLTDIELYQFDPTEIENATVVGAPAVSGNLIDDDGVDGRPDVPGSEDTKLLVKNAAGEFVEPGTNGVTVQGDYGTLTVQENGDYVYQPDADAANIGEVDTFGYRLEHPNGEVSEATFSAQIGFAAEESQQPASADSGLLNLDLAETFDETADPLLGEVTVSTDGVLTDSDSGVLDLGDADSGQGSGSNTSDSLLDVDLGGDSLDLFSDSNNAII